MYKKVVFFLILSFAGLFFFSCDKQEPINSVSELSYPKEWSSSLEEFAIILSRAVTNEESLRSFLKTEAAKQVDRDNDVFYPWTRNSQVKDNLSFSRLLALYDTKGAMPFIEKDVPTLTVLVPDWTWINDGCFSINRWDTSDPEIAVGYQTDSLTLSLYVDGSYAGSLEYGEFPSFPVLVVKANERIKVSPVQTRNGELSYEFVNDVFDGSKHLLTRSEVYTQEWDYIKDGSSDFVPETELNSQVITAYNEFLNGSEEAMQRDYVYYGMRKNSSNGGVLNPYVRERLYRFKISAESADNLIDTEDPQFQTELVKWRNKNAYSGNEIQPFLWSDGALEIHIAVRKKNKSTDSLVLAQEIVLNVKPEDLWQLKKSQVLKEWKFLSWMQNKYTYTNALKDLVSRWYYPETCLDFPQWDISKESTELWLHAYEYDDSQTVTEKVSHTYRYANNFKFSVGTTIEHSIKLTPGLEYSHTEETTDSSETTIITSHSSNRLGDLYCSFADPVINSPRQIKDGISGYNVRPLYNGTLTVTLIPHDIRY